MKPLAFRQRPALLAAGRFFFRYRNAVFPLLLLGLCAGFAPGQGRWSAALDAAGVLVILSGQALRAAVIGYAYIRRGGVNKQVYAAELVTRGFFALSRNPLYLGNLLIYAGLLLVQNHPAVYLLGGGFFLFAYHAIVAAEEAYLHEKFGMQYEAYCQRANRWWPDFFRADAALAGMSFNLQRVLIKDYSTFGSWSLALLVLLANQAVQGSGWTLAQSSLDMLGASAGLVLVVLGLTRVAKKRRWIRE